MKYRFAACGIAILAGAALLASPAVAQMKSSAPMMTSKEVETATQHAGLAAKAADLKSTQQHLHHVINCLVGPNGAGFDASFGNPCNGQGNGAISASTSPAKRKPLEAALAMAQDGIKQTNLAVAQMDGTMAQNDLIGKKMATKASMKKKPAMDGMSHPM
jgi:hypothetical protein